MIAIIASLLACAFPERGTVWKGLDTALVLDHDTIVVQKQPCSCLCASFSYAVLSSRDSTIGVQPFPGRVKTLVSTQIAAQHGDLLSTTAPVGVNCAYSAVIPAQESRSFLFKGKTQTWAVVADSIDYRSSSPSQDIQFRARWRWARVDTALPWVRWMDTIHLGGVESPLAQPVLTTLRSMSPVPFYAISARPNLTFLMHAGQDPISVDWGFVTYRDSTPEIQVAPGTTFRIAKVSVPAEVAIPWEWVQDSKRIDKIFTKGGGDFSRRHLREDSPRGHRRSVAIEPATGKRIQLATPLSSGPHLLLEPRGTRMLVVVP